MRPYAAILGLAASMAFAPAAFAGAPQNIDPTTGDPVIPEYQTQPVQQSGSASVETRDVSAYPQPPANGDSAMQTSVTTEQKTTGATNYGAMNNEPASHEQPKTIGQAGKQIGQDAGTAGKKVGETTREVTTTIGHGVRDTTKAIGHGTRDFFRGLGSGWSDAKD